MAFLEQMTRVTEFTRPDISDLEVDSGTYVSVYRSTYIFDNNVIPVK